MTEDPVKLYVVVMAFLLVILGYVAHKSWSEANAYEEALARAPSEAKRLRETGAEVNRLVDQLDRAGMGQGTEVTLVSNAAKRLGINLSSIQNKTDRIRGRAKAKEKKVVVNFGSGASSKPLTRQRIAQFCRAVELDSQRILKTMQIDLTRVTGKGLTEPGKADRVTDDLYRGSIVFGKRVVSE